MALGADDIEASCRESLLLQRRHFSADLLDLVLAGIFKPHLEIAAKLNVGTTAGHVGGDGHRAGHTGFGDDPRLFGMESRIQDIVRDLPLLQNCRQRLGFFDGDRSDQHRLATLAAIDNQLDDGVVALLGGTIDLVVMVDALHLDIGRDAGHLELVDFGEFAGFGQRRAGHAGKLVIQPEVILERDRCDRLVLGLNLEALARLDGLMQAFGEAASFHRTAGELVDDHHHAVLNHVMRVALEQFVRTKSLVHVMQQADILDVIESALSYCASRTEQLFGMFDACLGQRDRAALLVEIVILWNQSRNDAVGNMILVGCLLGLTGNDQRRTRFVDQDRVNLVDDREMMVTLNHVLDAELQVVTKVVEAEFIVGAIGHIAAIGGTADLVILVAGDAADAHAKTLIDLAHPGGIARSEIVIHGNDMNTTILKGVQEHRQRRHQCLTLTSFHLGDLALVKRNATHQLHIVVTLTQRALGGLANPGKSLGQKIVKCRTIGKTGAKVDGGSMKLFVAQYGNLFLESVDRRHLRCVALDRPVIIPRTKQVFRQRSKHAFPRVTLPSACPKNGLPCRHIPAARQRCRSGCSGQFRHSATGLNCQSNHLFEQRAPLAIDRLSSLMFRAVAEG